MQEVVNQFIAGTLDKITAGAKKAASDATDGAVIGGVVKSNAGTSVDATSVNALVKGIKEIVDLVIKEGNGQADKITPVDYDKKKIDKLFGATTDAAQGAEDKHVAAAASASIGVV